MLGYKVRGFVDSNHVGDADVLGRIDDLDRVIRAEFIDEVFITIPSERELVKRIVDEVRRRGLDAKVIPELYAWLALERSTLITSLEIFRRWISTARPFP